MTKLMKEIIETKVKFSDGLNKNEIKYIFENAVFDPFVGEFEVSAREALGQISYLVNSNKISEKLKSRLVLIKQKMLSQFQTPWPVNKKKN